MIICNTSYIEELKIISKTLSENFNKDNGVNPKLVKRLNNILDSVNLTDCEKVNEIKKILCKNNVE